MNLDRTFCIASACRNKCGRQLTNELRDALHLVPWKSISMAYFCDVDGEPLKEPVAPRTVRGEEN